MTAIKTKNLSFDEALSAAAQGCRIRRKGWENEEAFVIWTSMTLEVPKEYEGEENVYQGLAYRVSSGHWFPWNPARKEDVDIKDWMIF